MKKRIVLLLLALLALSGCANSQAADTAKQPEYLTDDKEKEEVVYCSTVNDGECALCDKAGKTLLPLYDGQTNLGIICINTMDLSPIEINRYNDYGELIEEKAGYSSRTTNSFGEGGMITSVSANPDRAYAHVHVGFTEDDCVDKESIESLLCQNCITAIMDEAWDEPYGVGVINFETLEVRLFEENISGFTFGDYYLDIDRREKKDDSDWTELDMVIFYCPPRYE